MHVMEIVFTTGMNGAVIHGTMLARELGRRGHRVTFLCLPNSWCGSQMRPEPIRIVESNLHRWPLDQLIRIGKFFLREGVDVIHTHLSRANFFGQTLSWLSGVPGVAHNHCVQLNWMFHDGVIAPSEATGRFQCTYNRVRPGRIEIVHNFVDHKRFSKPLTKTR
jgi:glycosyltransferase involved in cell wall biosynthesis